MPLDPGPFKLVAPLLCIRENLEGKTGNLPGNFRHEI
jgi:hypothetical protein